MRIMLPVVVLLFSLIKVPVTFNINAVYATYLRNTDYLREDRKREINGVNEFRNRSPRKSN